MEFSVDIIVPAYNAGKYIGRCLQSLIEQDYKNINICVVNDGSSDNTLSVINEYALKDDRVKVFDLEKNGGVSAARNYVLDNTHGDIVCFADSDDWVEKDFISTLVGLMDGQTVMASCDYTWKGERVKKFKKVKEKVIEYPLEEAFPEITNDRTLFGFLWNKAFLRSVMGDLRFNPEISLCEDTVFCLKYLERCTGGRVRHTTKRLYHYIKRTGSLSSLSCSAAKVKKLCHLSGEIQGLRERNTNRQAFLQSLNSWWFLMSVEFIFFAYRVKDKENKNYFKASAKEYKKDYKANKKNYKYLFRKVGCLLYALIKML